MTNITGPATSAAKKPGGRGIGILAQHHAARLPRTKHQHARADDHRRQIAERHQDEAGEQAEKGVHQSVIAIARSAMRSRADSFSVALLSWPQAARMSRPRGVRTGDE